MTDLAATNQAPEQTSSTIAQQAQGTKAQPERLYGRHRSHPLRARQAVLMERALPRMRLADPAHPLAGMKGSAGQTPRELYLEIGFGGGEHARAQAALHPDAGYIASEVFENGICSLLSALVPEGQEETSPPPPNLRLWPDDARALLDELPAQCLDRAYLMFPDPWPKARHAKRRFIHPDNLKRLARLLKPGSMFRIASDHPVYQQWVDEVMALLESQALFTLTSRSEGPERPEGWSPTRYEAKARAAGRQPFYWTFMRAKV
ncbi:tRNA (guanosine(46)-N7)-methyltransferase TrmB [Formicincola oecophyllae]|uniref:tRNA (guanine-N(7)-)-methyltransferase n=1 Tax=Formicincola oecophyllae TaxID=2558361 RepID=A0A4Y6U822_9PROT|nr:tRNA (guanine(46)-N(7))-methyltransferase TrmB [Formicincola oecophyllae]QDH13314.1 tRNA (guanosine(46)-N7)-methyltransferase TrmB [Formicincola oecophyllae]